jgi:2,3-bisphosphoglycerate-independent phosphoglycerate mutase
MESPKKPLVLVVLDGWGQSDSHQANAIYAAATPVWDSLWENQTNTLINCSGDGVGLPDGQMGNSEVGHMTIGAGRAVYQNLTRINSAIADGSFDHNTSYLRAIDRAVQSQKAVHIMGLLSPGGVHSHEHHLVAALELAARRGAKRLYLHAFLDGRDTPPRSARKSLELIEGKLANLEVGCIASLCGRYFAMDRDQRWERTEFAWQLLVQGSAEYCAGNALEALELAYGRGESDEFIKPTLILNNNQPPDPISDGDSVLFMNFRPDRARQLTRAFVDQDFEHFKQAVRPQLSDFVMTTQYADDIDAPCAFAASSTKNSIGEYLSEMGYTQLRIAETEKYAHVTFFFSAGREAEFEGEDRILIPSPKVATYDLLPEMSAESVADSLIEAIKGGTYDTIICNFANGDMVGHTGVFDAAIVAVEVLDRCLGRIIAAILEVEGQCLITADHGNVENMQDPDSGQALTSHTLNPVPLVYYGPRKFHFREHGSLADVAPTMLALLDLPPPPEMTGRSLLLMR